MTHLLRARRRVPHNAAPHNLEVFRPTMAVTLTRGTGSEREVLVGIRSKNNSNHAHVVSVPTMRVPVVTGSAILRMLLAGGREYGSLFEPGVGHDPIGHAIWSLLATKLSLADAIESGGFHVSVADYAAVQGRSFLGLDRDGADLFEALTMVNCLVEVHEGSLLIPAENATFSHLEFVPFDLFAEVSATKELHRLGRAFAGLETCVHGLCVASSVVLRDAPFAAAWSHQGPPSSLGVEWTAGVSARASAG